MKRWVMYLNDGALCCPCCDSQINIFTGLSDEEIEAGMYQDADEVQCDDHERCDLKNGHVSCDGEGSCSIDGDW